MRHVNYLITHPDTIPKQLGVQYHAKEHNRSIVPDENTRQENERKAIYSHNRKSIIYRMRYPTYPSMIRGKREDDMMYEWDGTHLVKRPHHHPPSSPRAKKHAYIFPSAIRRAYLISDSINQSLAPVCWRNGSAQDFYSEWDGILRLWVRVPRRSFFFATVPALPVFLLLVRPSACLSVCLGFSSSSLLLFRWIILVLV